MSAGMGSSPHVTLQRIKLQDGWIDGEPLSSSCCWKLDFSLKVKANVIVSVAGLLSALSSCCLCLIRELALYVLHSFFSIISLLPFAACNYCNQMVPCNKKPPFLPVLDKYLPIVLEQHNKKSYQDSEKITQRALLHLYKDLCSCRCEKQHIVDKCMLQIHIRVLSIRGQELLILSELSAGISRR